MKVTIDQSSGFCFGVVYAIEMAELELKKSEALYCLGDIVHNNKEVERLSEKGLKIIEHTDLKNLKNCKVLIRAHGEPPETYSTALENNIELIDASCPVVLKLQNRIRKSVDETLENDGQIIIYGKEGHAEVNGLVGQTTGNAIIVSQKEDLNKIDFNRPIYLYSQTTNGTRGFYEMKCWIEEEVAKKGNSDKVSIVVNDTICRQVSNREPELEKFSKVHDVIIFVSGQKSSNGKNLYKVCKGQNKDAHFVSEISDIKSEWFAGKKSAGICGATSTPMWLMEEVSVYIRKLSTRKKEFV